MFTVRYELDFYMLFSWTLYYKESSVIPVKFIFHFSYRSCSLKSRQWCTTIKSEVKKAQELSFLGTLAKFQRVTASFIMSVRMEQLGFHRTDLHEILYQSIFSKICQENSSVIKL